MKLFEGNEAQAFWDSLGGKTAYASGKILEEPVPSHPPRLFQCSNASGRFNVEEIFDYSQEVCKNCLLRVFLLYYIYTLSLLCVKSYLFILFYMLFKRLFHYLKTTIYVWSLCVFLEHNHLRLILPNRIWCQKMS